MDVSRRIVLHSALGPDQLMIKDASIREELGRLSIMDLDLLSPDENLALDDLLGRGFSLELVLDDDKSRFFHGVVAECSQTGRLGRYARYSAKVVPWLWLLTRTSDCRIFQQLSVPDIIKSVFREHGTSDFEDSLGSYSPRDYCVQYMETDFDFVSRLMEEEGIYYFFKHEQDKDTLVLCDSASAHSATPGCETITYYPPSENVVRDDDHIDHFLLSHSMQSGKLSHTDFDFIKPRTSLLAQYAAVGNYPKGDAEVFAYPGGYLTAGDGGRYAQRRLEALQQQHERVVGSGNVRALAVGALFTLEEFPREDQNREYLVVSTIYHFGGTDFESGVAHSSADVTVGFDAIPSKQAYRSPLTTRRTRVAGPQTAIVVGKAGEEIYTDQYGRVKVQFHWDRVGKRDENSSCWVRVSQLWAGKNWGAMHIPRIGQEVIVSFLEGDPDRPIITGRVYNAAEMPPYDLPANQTQSGIKSRSSKGGSPANFNEIRFEDKKGSELLTIHAEMNQDISVENDESHSVGHDRIKSVKHDETTTIDHDLTETIGHNVTRIVKNNEFDTISGTLETTVVDFEKRTNKDDYTHVVKGKRDVQVTKTDSLKVTGDVTNVFEGDFFHTTTKDQTWTVTGERHLKVSQDDIQTFEQDLTMSVSGATTLTSKNDLTIQMGKHSIVLSSSGIAITTSGNITMKGTTIQLNS